MFLLENTKLKYLNLKKLNTENVNNTIENNDNVNNNKVKKKVKKFNLIINNKVNEDEMILEKDKSKSKNPKKYGLIF